MQPTICSRCKKNVAVIFISRMEQYLKSQFPNLEIKKTECGNPFQVM